MITTSVCFFFFTHRQTEKRTDGRDWPQSESVNNSGDLICSELPKYYTDNTLWILSWLCRAPNSTLHPSGLHEIPTSHWCCLAAINFTAWFVGDLWILSPKFWHPDPKACAHHPLFCGLYLKEMYFQVTPPAQDVWVQCEQVTLQEVASLCPHPYNQRGNT